MSETKVQFSKDELDLLQNSAWILTKNAIIQKITNGFGELSEEMEAIIEATNPVFKSLIQQTRAKVSKGENYGGLPYLVLDYPRVFSRDTVLAIRTFFWWGNHFSITLHSKGWLVPTISAKIIKNLAMLQKGNYFMATSGDEWVHNLQADPHEALEGLNDETSKQKLKEAQFIRLGKIVPIGLWPKVRDSLWNGFEELRQLI